MTADKVLLVQDARRCFTLVSYLCQLCIQGSTIKEASIVMGTLRVDVPMERIAVDLMGPMNET